MKSLAWFIYVMIGCGMSMADPYKGLPELQRGLLLVSWPAVIVRDFINVMEHAPVERRGAAA